MTNPPAPAPGWLFASEEVFGPVRRRLAAAASVPGGDGAAPAAAESAGLGGAACGLIRPRLKSSSAAACVRVQAGLAIPGHQSEADACNPEEFGFKDVAGGFLDPLAAAALAAAPRLLLRVPEGGGACFSIDPWGADAEALAVGAADAALALCVFIDVGEGAGADVALSVQPGRRRPAPEVPEAAAAFPPLPAGIVVGIRAGRHARVRVSTRAECPADTAAWSSVAVHLGEAASLGHAAFADVSGVLRCAFATTLAGAHSRLRAGSMAFARAGGRFDDARSTALVGEASVSATLARLVLLDGAAAAVEDRVSPPCPSTTTPPPTSRHEVEAIRFSRHAALSVLPDIVPAPPPLAASLCRRARAAALDPDAVFALAALGVPTALARRLLLRAFAASTLDDIQADPVFAPLEQIRRAPTEDVLTRLRAALDARFKDLRQ